MLCGETCVLCGVMCCVYAKVISIKQCFISVHDLKGKGSSKCVWSTCMHSCHLSLLPSQSIQCKK